MEREKIVRILGIESSCDESALALIHTDGKSIRIEHAVVYSQIEEHKAFGGVIPEKAARRHLEILPELIRKSDIDFKKVDYIAVTVGPGLVTSLMIGLTIAKTLAWRYSIPLIGVNHVYGHILASVLPERKFGGAIKTVLFPALGLTVSGGHTELVLLNKKWRARIIGRTRDDAAGEAFDKAARLLGLAYPGGPEIEKLSKRGKSDAYTLPRPMQYHKSFDYSFSGLKNALRLLTLNKRLSKKVKADLAASFQRAVIDSLLIKLEKGITAYTPKSILLGGGVANNMLLRDEVKKLAKKYELPFFLTPRKYTQDNAVMIAWAGWHTKHRAMMPHKFSTLNANPQLSYEV